MDEATRIILIAAAAIVTICIVIATAIRAIRWARKGSPATAFVGWALLFLSAGTNPQPPPQEQVETANRQKRLKKQAESGDPES